MRRAAAAVALSKALGAVVAIAAVETAKATLMQAAWPTRGVNQWRRQLGQKATGDVLIVPVAQEAQVGVQEGAGPRGRWR